jgi:hypothetical protein
MWREGTEAAKLKRWEGRVEGARHAHATQDSHM